MLDLDSDFTIKHAERNYFFEENLPHFFILFQYGTSQNHQQHTYQHDTSVNTTIPTDASATTTPEHQHVTTTDMVEANPEDWHFTV